MDGGPGLRGPGPQNLGQRMSGYRFNHAVQDHKNIRRFIGSIVPILVLIIFYNTTVGYVSINYLLSQYFGTNMHIIWKGILAFYFGLPASILAAITWVLNQFAEIF